MFLTIALLIEQNEKPEKRMAQVKDTYEKLANRKISLGNAAADESAAAARQFEFLFHYGYG